MYHSKKFEVTDHKQVENLIKDYPFATLIAMENGDPVINHFPLILDSSLSERRLIGHMSRANSQWKIWTQNPKCYVIFQGPHTYITPNWYPSGDPVPTWNYAVVHIEGHVALKESFEEQSLILKKLTTYFEQNEKNPFNFRIPDDLADPNVLKNAIVSFEILITGISAKFKLSQNRDLIDQDGVRKGLAERADDMSRAVLKLMQLNK